MRLVIHDFAGHPFQSQLSRQLASLGHEVIHLYPAGLPGPKGRLSKCVSDPPTLRFEAIPLSGTFRKYSAHRRFLVQRKYAHDVNSFIRSERPDVVLSGNTPIDVQAELLRYCHKRRVGFVHWVQDVYCEALRFFLQHRFGPLARGLALPFRGLEKWVASASNGIVVISPGFKDLLGSWGIPSSKITVIENWAPLDEVPVLPRENAWRHGQGLGTGSVFLYSGTLGLKHKPDLLYSLAQSLVGQCTVVVISEGIGREYLQTCPPLPNLILLGFQPYERVPEILASADILVATLEADAGQFAVPSKVLSYFCAARPLLLAAPKENLSAEIVERSEAGVVVDPNDKTAWLAAAQRLASDQTYRAQLGANARRYAERAFDICRIAHEFQHMLLSAYCSTF